MRSNPPWTNRLLEKYWHVIKNKVGNKWMPDTGKGITPKRKRKIQAVEYGCGHYGCVGPTKDPGVK